MWIERRPRRGSPERRLTHVAPPRVAMFCGNLFVGDAALEADLSARMRQVIARENVGVAYGALAAGSDILIAELLLAHGADVHVVLPFDESDFLAQSVAPAGPDWLARYRAVRERAASLTLASDLRFGEQAEPFAYGSRLTMGLARLGARHLRAEAVQLAIVEERGARTLSGADIEAWRAAGGRAEVVIAPPLTRPAMPPPPTLTLAPAPRALMWSTSSAEPNARGTVAAFADAAAAAAAALDLREAGRARIALHFGSHAARAERLGAVAPRDTCVCTPSFAATLEVAADPRFGCVPAETFARSDGAAEPVYRLLRR